ncbi:MAG: c-type cytochrome [Anaerolineales bacterium]|nr:c-type cytochrome [Anaerolineales bacterium]
MKKVLKWIGIVVGSLLGLVLVAGLVMFLIGNSRLNKTYSFPLSNIVLPADDASLELGKHRVDSLCAGCHGEDLSGIEKWFNASALGTIDSANLTSGKGGVGETYTDEDYVNAIRHGIDSKGKPIFMPAVVSTANLSDEELGAIIAYIRSLPPVDHETEGAQFTPLAKVMLVLGVLPAFPVEVVSHNTDVPHVEAGPTVEYGKYMVDTHDCRLCHGPELNGGPFPDPTIIKISPNLTPGGEVAFWTEEQFVNTFRTGVTPGGHELDPALMPWKDYGKFYDYELQAIYAYLQTVEKLPQYTE